MQKETAQKLIQHIIDVLENEQGREQLKRSPLILCILRNQDAILTEKLDAKVAALLPQYYSDDYKLETTKNAQQDLPEFIMQYIKRIKNNQRIQGNNGVYVKSGTREIITMLNIISRNELDYTAETMSVLISTLVDTLLISNEDIINKLDAIMLLCYIVLKYPVFYENNHDKYEKLIEKESEIDTSDHPILLSSIGKSSLKIGIQFLFTAMGKDTYAKILELMPYIQNDIPTTVSVMNIIENYLSATNSILLPAKIESLVLQNTLQWLYSDFSDIREEAAKILLLLSRNPDNHGIINRQLVKLVDDDSAYIKNLILHHIYSTNGIAEKTRDYIIFKCKNDANFVVRMMCADVEVAKLEKNKE